MGTRRLTRFEIWLDAWRDRRHNLPAPNAQALGPAERKIQAAVNLTIRSLQDQYAKASEPLKARLTAAREQLRKVELPEWDRIVKKTGRHQEDVTLGAFTHHLLMAILSIGEGSFNVLAFAISGEATIFSVGMALAVTLSIPLLAFGAGVAARQFEPRRRKVWWTVGLSTVAILMLFVINQLRVSYLNDQRGLAGDAPWFANTMAYFAINIGVYLAAAVITYLSKDPDQGFVKAKRRVEAKKAKIAQFLGQLNGLAERLVHQVNMLHEGGHQAIAFYRAHNRRGRQEVPAYYDDDRDRNHYVSFVEVSAEHFDEEPANHHAPRITPAKFPRRVQGKPPQLKQEAR